MKPPPSKAPPFPIPIAEPSDTPLELDTLLQRTWNHSLLRTPCGERYFLTVLCGSAAIYSVIIELRPEEIADYQDQGKEAIETLVRAIQYNSNDFQNRIIELPKIWKWKADKPGLFD